MSAYLKFFELEKSPFDTSEQSNLVLGTKALRGAFAEIERGMAEGSARICVTGDTGMGKTSLARALPKLLGADARVVLLLNPSLSWSTLRAAIVKQLELEKGVLSRKALMDAASDGRRLVLAVDQAELTSEETLEHLDILLGYRSDSDEQLMTCILLANMRQAREQDDCALLWWLDKLNTLQLEFAPIPAAGVQSYITKHLKRAGWKGGHLFTPEAAEHIHRVTGGVPGKVSDTCERVLHEAAERNLRQIGAELVDELFGAVEAAPQTGSTAPRAPESETLDREPPPRDSRAESPSGHDVPVSAPAPRREVLKTPVERPTPAERRGVFKPVAAPISLDTFFDGSSGSDDVGVSAGREPDPSRGGRGRWIAVAAALALLAGSGAWLAFGPGANPEPALASLEPAPPSRRTTDPDPVPLEGLQLGRKKGAVTAGSVGEQDGVEEDWDDPLFGPAPALDESLEAAGPPAPGETDPAVVASASVAELGDDIEEASPLAKASTDAPPESSAQPPQDGASAQPDASPPASAAVPAAPAMYRNPADVAVDEPFW